MKFLTTKINLILFFIPILYLNSQPALEEDGLPPVPGLQTAVYDYAGILNNREEHFLREKLIRYSDSTSTQIVIASIPDLQGHDINLYAAEWAHKWGIGQKGKDNGIFILVAPNDRKVSIQVGYGVEPLLTDALSRRIIDRIMIPHFRKEDYFNGLNSAVDTIFKILTGEFKPDANSSNENFPVWLVIVIVVFILIILFLLSKHHKGGGGYTIDNPGGPVIWGGGSYSGGSGWGGGFGGGGFSGGFGGGGFGGGGASGSW